MSRLTEEDNINTNITDVSIDTIYNAAARYPARLGRPDFWRAAYPMMYASRVMDGRIKELFRKGLVKGTVILTGGNEAGAVGMAMPFRPGVDPAALLHRDLPAHLILGCPPRDALCQYLANAQSPTHGKEGNVHFGDAAKLRFPMISHLGGMLAVAVGATWSARQNGSGAFGLAVIGDGGSSTGQFHESLNMASVHNVPVVFIVENNGYAFSTTTEFQYNCKNLSDRAAAYGITGKTVNGLDAFEVYSAVTDALDLMSKNPQPVIIETLTVRLEGHAVYDNAEYVPDDVKAANAAKDPIKSARLAFIENCGVDEKQVETMEKKLTDELDEIIRECVNVPRPIFSTLAQYNSLTMTDVKSSSSDNSVSDVKSSSSDNSAADVKPSSNNNNGAADVKSSSNNNNSTAAVKSSTDKNTVSLEIFAPANYPAKIKPYAAQNARNTNAVNAALEHILSENDDAFLCGQDVGAYGSPFKTCKGLIDKFGAARVIDMPICEAGTVGFCLGASQTGKKPIIEFQFADFSTEAVSQLGLNAGTWFFRADRPAPLLCRLPCGAGITLGAFHSAEFEGLWSRFPGLILLYPVTPQETYEALMLGFYNPNPCVVFEHKLLYWGRPADIDFDGDLQKICRPRKYSEGRDVTIIATGAMVEQALNAVAEKKYSADVWNPFILGGMAESAYDPIWESVRKTGRLVVVQESGETAGLGNHFIALAARKCFSDLKRAPALVSAPDMPVPFARELETAYLPDAAKIGRALDDMMR